MLNSVIFNEHAMEMDIAIEEARYGIQHNHGGPFGAVIVDKNGDIIGTGHNRVLIDNDSTAHGEIVAIRNACANLKTYDLSDCILYTTSYLCPMCLGAIMWSRISKVYYGCSIEDAEEIGFDDKTFYENFINKSSIEFRTLSPLKCKELFNYYNSLNAQKY